MHDIENAAERSGHNKSEYLRTLALSRIYENGSVPDPAWDYSEIYEELMSAYGVMAELISTVSNQEEGVEWCDNAILDKSEKVMHQLEKIQGILKPNSQSDRVKPLTQDYIEP